MNSFRRSNASSDENKRSLTKIPGVKQWVNNSLGLVSFGNKQVDELMGGGLALGTVLLIEMDSFSNFGEILFLYSISESICMQHDSLLITSGEEESNRLIALLPFNQNLEVKNDALLSSAVSVSSENKHENKHELNIAWQYTKYFPKKKPDVQQVHSTTDSILSTYCCSYDLSKRMQEDLLSSGVLRLCHLSDQNSVASTATSSNTSSLSSICDWILQQVAQFISSSKAVTQRTNVTRIFISINDIILHSQTVGGTQSSPPLTSATIARFILSLKSLARGKHVAIVLTIQPDSVSRHLTAKVSQMADSVITLESFAGRTHSVPYEFKEFHGFLLVSKVQQYGMLAPFRPANCRYGVKRDRRKLHVEPLHLPPEESRAFGAAGTDAQLAARSTSNVDPSNTENTIQIHSHSKFGAASSHKDNAHNHQHDHGHDHHQQNVSMDTPGTAASSSTLLPPHVTNATTAAVEVDASAPKMTPLAMKLAAARAARQQGMVVGASSVGESSILPLAPVSIASKSNKLVSTTTAPVQPGSLCGSKGVGPISQSKIDF